MLNIRRPAYPGVTPTAIKWKLPAQEEIVFLHKHLGCDLVDCFQKKDDKHSDYLVGYYRSLGNENFFVKVLNEADNQSQFKAEYIAAWLNEAGISVSCVRTGYPKKIEEHNLWIYLYDYIDHEFFTESNESLYLIGEELGKMHKLMKKYPSVARISFEGNRKNKLLFQQLNDIKTGNYLPSFSESAVKLIKRTSNDEYQSLAQFGQMIHGDMNFGNIIFAKGNHQPIFIDFEDSNTAWLSPLYDIAFIIQRFILSNNVQDKIQASSFFLKGYHSKNNLQGIMKEGYLSNMLKMISVRSLLILSTLTDSEQKLYVDEVNKFIHLHKKMDDYADILFEIERLAL